MKQTGAEYIIHFLEANEADYIAGMPGGANLPLYEALYNSQIQPIAARHEQGAGFIAQGIARSSGKTGVCLATSGPGATNLLTALADAKLDSIPILAITGQVPTNLIGTDAFQEVNIVDMAKPSLKLSYSIQSPEMLAEILPFAFEQCQQGRKGPVLLDIPKDIQTTVYNFPELKKVFPIEESFIEPDHMILKQWARILKTSQKPILFIGGGVIAAGCSEEIKTLSEISSLPVISTLNGLGAFADDHPNFLGMPGMHGNAYTNMALELADTILAIGVRFDDRVTGTAQDFCTNAKILHVDIDANEIGKIIRPYQSLCSDAQKMLSEFLPYITTDTRKQWWHEINHIKRSTSIIRNQKNHPHTMIRSLANNLHDEDIITTDVGQHQMWLAQSFPFKKPGTFLTSGGFGSMGFGIPAAIGAALVNPNKTIVCITGDGSFLLNFQEMAIIKERNLNIKIILFNNHCLGLVKQQQEMFYNNRKKKSFYSFTPDFIALAGSFGIEGKKIQQEQFHHNIFDDIFTVAKPYLLELVIQPELNVYPIVPPGKANREMILY